MILKAKVTGKGNTTACYKKLNDIMKQSLESWKKQLNSDIKQHKQGEISNDDTQQKVVVSDATENTQVKAICDGSSDDEEREYIDRNLCPICDDDEGTMIECEDCLSWYHPRCIGMKMSEFNKICNNGERFKCYFCEMPIVDDQAKDSKSAGDGEKQLPCTRSETLIVEQQNGNEDSEPVNKQAANYVPATSTTTGENCRAPATTKEHATKQTDIGKKVLQILNL